MKPDWPTLIAELRKAGPYTHYKLATILGLRTNQLDRIIAGAEPKYGVGQTIITLHEVLCNVPRETSNLLRAQTG